MNEAEWTATERAELARDQREGFILSKAFFGRAKAQTVAAVALASLLGLSFWSGRLDTIFFAVAFFSLGSIPLARHWEKRQEARHEIDPEMQAALRQDGRLVSLIVRQGDAPMGEDWGMLWFEEGHLYFSGRRTSFGLVPKQAQNFTTIDEGVAGVRHPLNLVLQREGPAGPVTLSFAPAVSPTAHPYAVAGALKMDLDRWLGGRAQGEGQWPPMTLGPRGVSERHLLARGVVASLIFPLFPALLFLAVSAPNVALMAFILGVVVFTFAPANALVWRAWWARRRLRKLE